ncbi:MAG: hypothetical protein OEW84_08425 [Aigarchaeota archaeon]|nr:hypothetical protein [Aigarchaeota archaeon]
MGFLGLNAAVLVIPRYLTPWLLVVLLVLFLMRGVRHLGIDQKRGVGFYQRQ